MLLRPHIIIPEVSNCCYAKITAWGLCSSCQEHTEPYEPTDEEIADYIKEETKQYMEAYDDNIKLE